MYDVPTVIIFGWTYSWWPLWLVAVGIIKAKTTIALVLYYLVLAFCVYGAYDIHQEMTELRDTNKKLTASLKEKNRNISNWNLVCSKLADPMGEIVYVDCGESFAPRYATCACTLWCLEDYNFATSSRDPAECQKNKSE